MALTRKIMSICTSSVGTLVLLLLVVTMAAASPSIILSRPERALKTCPGFAGYCSESYPGDTCLVVCAFGRNNVPKCQDDGTWTDIPRCIEHEPGKQEQVTGGCPGIPGYCSLDYPGGVCEFDCLAGPDIRSTCQEDGTWAPYPTCQGDIRETRDGCDPCPGPFGGPRNRTAEASGGAAAPARRNNQQPRQPAAAPQQNGRRNNRPQQNRQQPQQPARRPPQQQSRRQQQQQPPRRQQPQQPRRQQPPREQPRRQPAPQQPARKSFSKKQPTVIQPTRQTGFNTVNSVREQPRRQSTPKKQQQQSSRRNQQRKQQQSSANSVQNSPFQLGRPAPPSKSNNNNNQGSGGRCPGNALEACIDVCPSFSARIFGACVAGCARRCPGRK